MRCDGVDDGNGRDAGEEFAHFIEMGLLRAVNHGDIIRLIERLRSRGHHEPCMHIGADRRGIAADELCIALIAVVVAAELLDRTRMIGTGIGNDDIILDAVGTACWRNGGDICGRFGLRSGGGILSSLRDSLGHLLDSGRKRGS